MVVGVHGGLLHIVDVLHNSCGMFGIERLLVIRKFVKLLAGDDFVLIHGVLIPPTSPMELHAFLVLLYRHVVLLGRIIICIDIRHILVGIRIEVHHNVVVGRDRGVGVDELCITFLGFVHPNSLILLGSR